MVASVVMVTGAAGYIGSHTALALSEAGHEIVVVDDLSEGHRPALRGLPLAEGSLLDPDFLRRTFAQKKVDAVMHFAARCYVGESVKDPGLYYRANVMGTLNLLDAMVEAGVTRFVFSSTCATYGEPRRMPITEDEAQEPVNPYGASKLMCERLLRDFGVAHGVDSVSLRYFNAAGADPEGRLGEDHRPETHLIPLVLGATSEGGPELKVFGDDYPTPDGTCVRDYVHVTDLAAAHVLALDSMLAGAGGFRAYNLGNEVGTSVREVIAAAERVTGRRVRHRVTERRPGDPPVLVGSSALAEKELGWRPRFGDIDTIVSTAMKWHEAHPEGYGGA